MKTYRVEYTKRALRCLEKFDKYTRRMLSSWMSMNIDGCSDPRKTGKALKGQFKDCWRYRIGDYRVLCRIYDDRLLVLSFKIGHRKDVYE